MRKSRVLNRLAADQVVIAGCVGRVAEPWLAEMIGHLGYDLVWLDLEHRPIGYEVIDRVSAGCRAGGIDLMVRIRKGGYDSPMRALEFGANGIMVPHCADAAEARRWVEWTRFPPAGKRGFDGAGIDAGYGFADTLAYLREANEQTFLVMQIEDPQAVDCVEEIAAVDGVDGLFVGFGDLSIAYGVPFQAQHPLMVSAVERVARAAAQAGKWWGIPTGDAASARRVVDLGARLITGGSDHVALMEGFQNSLDALKNVKAPA